MSELDAVARTKADPNRSRREDQLVAEIERLEALVSGLPDDWGALRNQGRAVHAPAAVSEAPAELWARPSLMSGRYYTTRCTDEPDAVRYVRADLYEALLGRMAVVRSWNEAPCLEPLPPDAGAHEQRPGGAMVAALRALKEAACLEPLP